MAFYIPCSISQSVIELKKIMVNIQLEFIFENCCQFQLVVPEYLNINLKAGNLLKVEKLLPIA